MWHPHHGIWALRGKVGVAVLLCSCSIGLQNSEGIGLISYNSATLVTLGGCPLENRVYQYSIANTSTEAVCVNNMDTGLLEAKLGPPSSSYSCAVSLGHALAHLAQRASAFWAFF